MHKIVDDACTTFLGTLLIVAGIVAQTSASAQKPLAESEVLEQVERYSSELDSPSGDILDRDTDVTQFRDVQPTDWAYEALRGLVERYGCIEGYPDRTYRGSLALTRYEFAAGLYSCLTQIERLIATSGGGLAPEDLERLQSLTQEFEAELATLETRIDNLEGRVAFLEDNHFSTTTKLFGQIIFNVGAAFGEERASGLEIEVSPPGSGDPGVTVVPAGEEDDIDSIVTFGNRVRLNFDTSFTGEDRLRARLQARNLEAFDTGTGMTTLNYGGNNENDIVLTDMSYIFQLGENLELMIGANGVTFDSYVDPLSPYFAGSANISLSFLGSYNVLVYPSSDAGLIASYSLGDNLTFYTGYLTINANDPALGGGLFNGDYNALAQANLGLGKTLDIALTYTRTYQSGGTFELDEVGQAAVDEEGNFIIGRESQVSLTEGLGSPLSINPFGFEAGVSSDRVGLTVSWQLAPSINLGGWFTYVNAEAQSTFREGDRAELVTGVATLALLDIGKEGSVLGLIAGVPPKLISNQGGPKDDDTSVLVEAHYRFPFNENVAITPGAYVVFSPNHDNDNSEVYVGIINTIFTF